MQYALGNADFYGIKISVNKNVLIPRPETEELAEKAIEEINARAAEETRVLDLCTGSGAIAIAIAAKCGAKVTASDISEGALQVAGANALNAGADIEFVKSDLFNDIEGKFDVIVSNPPYIPTEDIKSLDDKVKNFEPALALDAGSDGLKFYRAIAEGLEGKLAENGVLYLELGIGQAESIKDIFGQYDTQIIEDMQGVPRIAAIKRKV